MRILIFIALILCTGCAALPMDGSLLKKVTAQEERAPEIRAVAEGESCRCEAVCQ